MIKNILNLGDAGIYCDFGDDVNKDVNLKVINYFKTLKQKKIEGIINIAPSYNKLIISIDLNKTNYGKIVDIVKNIKIENNLEQNSKKIDIPICCDEDYELDLKRLEKKLNKSKDQIVSSFINKEYFCYMSGFIAGMPFMGDIESGLRTKRLETPRLKVPRGSVGITEQFCNIYTFDSPGGWNIIGNTPINIFDKKNDQSPVKINPGDLVKFYKISKKEYNEYI